MGPCTQLSRPRAENGRSLDASVVCTRTARRANSSTGTELEPTEKVFAFLDDLYVTTTRERAHTAFQAVAQEVEQKAGVRTHLGKLRAWSRSGGPAPAGLAALGPEVWTADKAAEKNGIVVLGVPLGTDAFVEAHLQERLQTEQRLLDELPELHDLVSAWCLLSQCAVPRANHTLRTLPPSLSSTYATSHDDALWSTFCKLLGTEGLAVDQLARDTATLPGRLGGLGLRSAARAAPAAYWASWVTALPVLSAKTPELAKDAVAQLVNSASGLLCVREAQECFGAAASQPRTASFLARGGGGRQTATSGLPHT